MCTFNLAVDEDLVNNARSAFKSEELMTLWLEKQLCDLLSKVSVTTEVEKQRT